MQILPEWNGHKPHIQFSHDETIEGQLDTSWIFLASLSETVQANSPFSWPGELVLECWETWTHLVFLRWSWEMSYCLRVLCFVFYFQTAGGKSQNQMRPSAHPSASPAWVYRLCHWQWLETRAFQMPVGWILEPKKQTFLFRDCPKQWRTFTFVSDLKADIFKRLLLRNWFINRHTEMTSFLSE